MTLDLNYTAHGLHTGSKRAALIFGSETRMVDVCRETEHLGITICDGSALIDPAELGAAQTHYDLLLIDLQSKLEQPEQHLVNVSNYLHNGNVEAVIWTDLEGLEKAYAFLPVSRCHFLVGASSVDTMLTIARAIRRVNMNIVRGINREIEFSALHRISDELADFAKTLARIAEQDGERETMGFAEKPVTFRPAPSALMQPFTSPVAAPDKAGPDKAGPDKKATARSIRETIKSRRLRERYFAADLFADPAWDILLDLFAARAEGVSVSVSSLCIAAAVPPTTALRWITAMTSNGILSRRHDPNDARRVFIELSNETAEQLESYFLEIRRRRDLL
jgi:hypothetical protein